MTFFEFLHFGGNHKCAIRLVRMLDEIIIVVAFCRPEGCRRQQFGHDRVGKISLPGSDHLRSSFFLFFRLPENGRSILRAHIVTLTIRRGWVVCVKENIKQVLVSNNGRIKFNPHYFYMTGVFTADLFVSRVLHMAAAIARLHRLHALQLLEHSL